MGRLLECSFLWTARAFIDLSDGAEVIGEMGDAPEALHIAIIMAGPRGLRLFRRG